MLDKGLTALSDVWTWIGNNETLSLVIGVAVATIVIGAVVGLFFRR